MTGTRIFDSQVALPDDRFDRTSLRTGVAEDAVIDSVVQGLQDGFWGLEVHVSYPHGQDVVACVLLPFLAIRI